MQIHENTFKIVKPVIYWNGAAFGVIAVGLYWLWPVLIPTHQMMTLAYFASGLGLCLAGMLFALWRSNQYANAIALCLERSGINAETAMDDIGGLADELYEKSVLSMHDSTSYDLESQSAHVTFDYVRDCWADVGVIPRDIDFESARRRYRFKHTPAMIV